MISIVIPTIGRPTLTAAIESILREGMTPIVVSDGVELSLDILDHPDVTFVTLGRRFGKTPEKTYYGQIAITTGVYLSKTEFTGCLGDDDELAVGAGDVFRAAITANPATDIWIPILEYRDGGRVCGGRGHVVAGNISHPIYRSIIFSFIPMYHLQDEEYGLHDFFHVQRCVTAGWTIDWLEACGILIRPRLTGKFGHGELTAGVG